MAYFLFRLLVWSVEAVIGWMIASAAAYLLLSSVWFPAVTIAPLASLVAQGDFEAVLGWLGANPVVMLSILAGAVVVIQVIIVVCLLFVSVIQGLETENYAKPF
jgi:hypothetical protein